MKPVLLSDVLKAPATDLTTVWTAPCGAITDASYGTTDNFPSVTHPHAARDPKRTGAWASSCGPPGWYDRDAANNVGYFSPGICPRGYTAACTWYATEQGPKPGPHETAYNCLPYGYTCHASLYYGDNESLLVNRNGINEYNTYLAPMFFIRWRSEDLLTLETDPLTPGNPQTRTVMVTATPTQSPATTTCVVAPTTPNATTTGGSPATAISTTASTPMSTEAAATTISRGAVAGIAVGSIFGFALILAAIFLLWRRRTKDNEGHNPAAGESDNPTDTDTSNIRHEMYAEHKGPDPTTPAELPVEGVTVNDLSDPSLASRPGVISWLSELNSNAQDDLVGQHDRWTASTLTSASPVSPALPVIGTGLYPPPTASMANQGQMNTLQSGYAGQSEQRRF